MRFVASYIRLARLYLLWKDQNVENEKDLQYVNSLIALIAKIREALGVGHKPMLSELPEESRKIRSGFNQYERIKSIGAIDFLSRWQAYSENDWDKFIESL